MDLNIGWVIILVFNFKISWDVRFFLIQALNTSWKLDVSLWFQLSVVDTVTINNYVLSKISISIKSRVVVGWWLIYRPVVERRIPNGVSWWNLCQFVLLSIIDFMSINCNVLPQIFSSLHSMIVWARWLINRPIIKWWVNNWILWFYLC